MAGMSYPRWITRPLEGMNLREVAPGLYVGEETSPLQGGWGSIVDFYGHASEAVQRAYPKAKRYVRLPFEDGNAFPAGALDAAWDAWQLTELEGGDTLLHCQAGISRSASAAYAFLRRRYGLRRAEALARVVTPFTASRFPLKPTLQSADDWTRSWDR
jgi:hypothetical protein